jgi:pumilio homology domain family member 6
VITGRVKDFVFKHDSVRVIQCALKYANQEQRKQIAKELKGEFKALAESRYAKFLVAKLVVEGYGICCAGLEDISSANVQLEVQRYGM